MVVGAFLMGMAVPVIMVVTMVMAMIVVMSVAMPVRTQGVVVRHDHSLARYRCKVA